MVNICNSFTDRNQTNSTDKPDDSLQTNTRLPCSPALFQSSLAGARQFVNRFTAQAEDVGGVKEVFSVGDKRQAGGTRQRGAPLIL